MVSNPDSHFKPLLYVYEALYRLSLFDCGRTRRAKRNMREYFTSLPCLFCLWAIRAGCQVSFRLSWWKSALFWQRGREKKKKKAALGIMSEKKTAVVRDTAQRRTRRQLEPGDVNDFLLTVLVLGMRDHLLCDLLIGTRCVLHWCHIYKHVTQVHVPFRTTLVHGSENKQLTKLTSTAC